MTFLAMLALLSAPLNAAQAQAVVEGCRSHASSLDQGHAIAVVDSGGHLVAALRMDGYREGMMAFSERKARAAALWGFATSGMEAGARETPGFADAPYVETVAGGVPIFDPESGELLGAIGTSGQAPSDDEACAVAGIEAAGLSPRRPRS